MIVRPAIRMFSAISFGVFWRSAPSTSAIMRSRNVSPGFDVILILMWSESTRVPPVTALRSPPDSRMTGALSPVITDFVDRRDAFDDLAVAGNDLAGARRRRRRRRAASTTRPARCRRPSTRRLAIVSVFVLRSDSACALPRASAIASAKVANSTVNQSQRSICSSKPIAPAPVDDVADEEQQHQRRADLDDEDDRVLHQRHGIQLQHRILERAAAESPDRTAAAPARASSGSG